MPMDPDRSNPNLTYLSQKSCARQKCEGQARTYLVAALTNASGGFPSRLTLGTSPFHFYPPS
jgi:hypothetical protein